MKKNIFLVGAIIGTLAAPALAADWTYEGSHGADRWGQLQEDFEMCERGIMQSPIDLGGANAVGDVDVALNWQSGPLTLLNNGHTIQANFAEGSSMTSGGTDYNLLQVHLHTPSEHVVDGEAFPMVAHFVHATAEGGLAVLGVMFEQGAANSELQKIIDAAPTSKRDAMAVEGVKLDPSALLPSDLGVYRYMGSLTTPPCSEGVNWHVVKQPVSASVAQLQALGGIMGENARPVQLLNGRLLVAPE